MHDARGSSFHLQQQVNVYFCHMVLSSGSGFLNFISISAGVLYIGIHNDGKRFDTAFSWAPGPWEESIAGSSQLCRTAIRRRPPRQFTIIVRADCPSSIETL